METTERMSWYLDARYGMFMHFGLYSALAGYYKGVRTPYEAEWIMRHMEIPVAEYRRLAEDFDPTDFDADAIVRRAKEDGFRYFVFTAKHHDGFAMYDSAVSDYNIMHTPYGKDILREVEQACRKYGMKFCVYYSQMQDWDHPDGDGNTWDYPAEKKDFRRYFYEKALPQVRELLTNYGEVGLIWFDTPYDMPEELCRELADEVHRLQPMCLISGRIGYYLGDYKQTGDRCVPLCAAKVPFEVPMTMNHTWGYAKDDDDFKDAATVLQMLVDTVGKGGNLLLNLGPDATGKVPEASFRPLDEVGAWLRKNGESIYGAGAAPDFPYQLPFGGFTYRADTNTLYMHVIRYPFGKPRIVLLGLITPPLRATLADGTPTEFIHFYEKGRDEYRLKVMLPAVAPDALDTVVALPLSGKAEVQTV